MKASNPYDGTAAMVVPQNVEKIPLFHWRPGTRCLSVGSRDGAAFSGGLPDDEQRTFRRQLSPELISGAAEKVSIDTWSASWTASLSYRHGLEILGQSGLPYSIVSTAGFGEADCVDACLSAAVSAWSLLIAADADLAPHASTIIARGQHVEVCLGLNGTLSESLISQIDWSRVSAVHLMPLKTTLAIGSQLQDWEGQACELLPSDTIVYHSASQNTRCRQCGEELIWRSGGRSRPGALDQHTNTCSACGHPTPLILTGS